MTEEIMHPDDVVQKALTDHEYFIETFISIKDKDRFIIPFVFNPIQKLFYKKYVELNAEGIDRHIILKPRQLGFTTLICALFLTECILVPNTVAAIIAHDAESTARIFEITKLMYEKLPDEIRPSKRYSSKREIVFEDIGSKIFIGTAGSVGFGRGTTINLLHASEYAFWEHPEELMPSLLETVPKNGIIIYETTANGFNHFHTDYNNAKDASPQDRKLNQIPYPHFYRWFDHPEYRFTLTPEEENYVINTLTDDEKQMIKVHGLDYEQITWRRSKQSSLKDKFVQEYPEDDSTCFIASGKPFYDAKTIKSIILWNEENKTWDKKNNQGVIITPGWSKKEMDGKITIYKKFIPGETYIAAADPAEGNPTSDNSTCYILRLNKEPIFVEFCAEIADKLTMPKFYKLMYHLCAQYSFPKLVIERNNHGHLLNYWATNGYMQDQIKILDKYPNVYFAKDAKPGFVSSSVTRPLILDNNAELLRNNMLVIYSRTWLDQALSFVYGANGKPQASEGKHDDSIIAASVGSFILMNEKNSSSFSFLNKDAFGIGAADMPRQSVYDHQKLMYADDYKHPLDNNVQIGDLVVGDPETVDWAKFIK